MFALIFSGVKMGRYSDSEDEYRRSKKKKKRISRFVIDLIYITQFDGRKMCCRQTQKNQLVCKTFYENARVSHLPRVDGVESSPNVSDHDPVTLTHGLDPYDI